MIKSRKKEAILGVIFASPVILGFAIFVLMPLGVSFYQSLTDFHVIRPETTFVGLQNYREFFDGTNIFFFQSLRVTTFYVILAVPLQIAFAFSIALLLNVDIKGRSLFRTIFYLPTVVPAVASSIVWMMLFDPNRGIFNSILNFFGLPGSRWIFGEATAIPSLALMSLWTVGGTIVIFLAGLQNVPKEQYEAVEVDGGGTFSKFRAVTLPLVTPVIFFNLIMSFITSFQIFTQVFIMTGAGAGGAAVAGGPNNATLVYVLLMYREAFQHGNIGVASALGWILFLIIFILTLLIFRSSALWVYYEGETKNK